MTIEARIRRDIEERIHSGEWKPGFRIPFEHELGKQYACSRATVSKALGGLAKAGLIERRRKAGSFVAHPQVHFAVIEVPDLAQIVAARGQDYRWALGDRRQVDTEDDFAASSLHIDGVHFAGGEPFAIERRRINLNAVPDAAAQSFDLEAPGTWLLRHIPWTTASHRIRAVEAGWKDAGLLAVRHRSACLAVDRNTWRAGEIVTQVHQLFRGDRFDLVADFSPRT